MAPPIPGTRKGKAPPKGMSASEKAKRAKAKFHSTPGNIRPPTSTKANPYRITINEYKAAVRLQKSGRKATATNPYAVTDKEYKDALVAKGHKEAMQRAKKAKTKQTVAKTVVAVKAKKAATEARGKRKAFQKEKRSVAGQSAKLAAQRKAARSVLSATQKAKRSRRPR
jgi:hypothetical protein